MTDGLKASQNKGGIRPSKSFDQGTVCKDNSGRTKLSHYNEQDQYCTNCHVNNHREHVRLLQNLNKV